MSKKEAKAKKPKDIKPIEACRPMSDEELALIRKWIACEHNYYAGVVNAHRGKKFPKDWNRIWWRMEDLSAILGLL